jgi:LuxR family transcriptional regulator, maltose regulon positive regulatory protein
VLLRIDLFRCLSHTDPRINSLAALYNGFMPIAVLATKLYIPSPRPSIVLRPRLIERLNAALVSGSKVTLISAPAGFGKTTLISEWLVNYDRPVAWLSLDEGDNDPIRFLTYLITALQTLALREAEGMAANIGAGVLAVLHASQPQPPPIELLLTELLNEITTIHPDFILVLDDYHLTDSKPVDKALTFLIEHLPPQLHLVIATREDPHLPLARLRVRGQLTELRAADLRFTPEEAGTFLNQMMNLNLSVENINALEARTEGWIAGLQLAALSMQGNEDISSFIKSFTGSHRFVLDYLIEEVLEHQSKTIQTFLLYTSILDRMCGPLCDAVLSPPSASGQETLEYLEHTNLFIVPLDNERRWYRYHHLFVDLLRQRLQRNSTLIAGKEKGAVHELNRRASEWYERNGLAADAIHHALAGQDFGRAATLIEKTVPEIRKNRQEATVMELGWLKALPDELIHVRPVLSVAYAYALFGGGELEAVEDWLRDAERWLDTTAGFHGQPDPHLTGMVVVDEKEFRRLPGMIAMLRTAQALARSDLPETVKNARQVLELALDGDHLLLGGAASTLGLAAWTSGDLDAARQMITDGMANVRRAGYITPAIGNAITLADIQIVQGCLHEAMSTYQQALHWATAPGAPSRSMRGAADMHVGISSLCYEHNDLNAATQHLLTSQSLGELAGMPQNPYRWCAAMARIREAQGDLDGALDLLDQAERLYVANFSPNVRPIAARKARVWVAQGRLDEALGWARAQGLSVENELSYLREFDHITLARVLLTCNRSDHAYVSISEVMRLLERLLKAAEAGGRMGSMIEILVLQAMAYHAQGDLSSALKPLRKALTLAKPEDYLRIFVDEGEAMRLLLENQSRNRDHPLSDYVAKLLAAFPQPVAAQKSARPGPARAIIHQKSDWIEPLSERELEVLKLLRSDLSGPEIAFQLSVSINTFRTHTKNIFIKLGVNDRRAAVRRSEELNLI